MSLSDDIIREVNKHKGKNSGIATTIISVVQAISPLVAFKSLPASVVLWIISYAVKVLWGNKDNLKETAMPDTWIKQVSESDGVSSQGIQFLNSRNQKKGYISVQDAIDFLEVEKVDDNSDVRSEDPASKVVFSEKDIQKVKEEISEAEHEQNHQSGNISGAEALKKRAERERKDFIDVDKLSKGFDQIAKSFDFEGGIESVKRAAKNFLKNK